MPRGPVKTAKQKLQDEIGKLTASIESYNQKIADYQQKIKDAEAAIEEKKKEIAAEDEKKMIAYLAEEQIDYDTLVEIVAAYKKQGAEAPAAE